MTDAILPLALQVTFLAVLVQLARPAKNTGIFYTYFNPAAFVALFTTLFFIFPEIYGLLHGYYLDGYPGPREQGPFVGGMWVLVLFLGFVCLGVLVAQPLSRRAGMPDVSSTLLQPLTRKRTIVLILFLIAGILANIHLSVEYSHSTGFRSLLVKSKSGRFFTTVVFFGEFAVALLTAHAIKSRRYVVALGVFAAFAASVTLTESRGRILWPAAIAVTLLISRQTKMRFGRLAVAALISIVILLLLDPLTKHLSTGQPVDLWASLRVDSIFEHRNFDGLSNLVLISQSTHLVPDSARWLSGANNDFMNHFFPAVLAEGVAYGVTVPGWFYMAGGTLGVCAGAAVYGVGLEYLNGKIRRITSPELLVGYLFAVSWLAAVGGNVVGSLDKAVANFAPAVVYLLLTREPKRSNRPRGGQVTTHSGRSQPAPTRSSAVVHTRGGVRPGT